MDLRDEKLNALIEAALQPGTNVSAQQRQFARERLMLKARLQEVSPCMADMHSESLLRQVMAAGAQVWRRMANFITEEGLYERARQNRCLVTIGMSAPGSRMVIQMFEPSSGNLLIPVF
jgi:hypothetical protein